MDWKEEVLKRLDGLAAKLGVASQHLWEILVRQAIATGIADAVLALLFGVGVVVGYKLFVKQLLAFKATENYTDEGPYIFGMIGSGLLGVVSLIASPICLYSAILELVNPQYYALHETLQALVGGSK